MAEDDPQDQFLVKKAFHQSRLLNNIEVVEDGEQLMEYLRKEGSYKSAKRPDIILLDLNMPRKDGREALKEIKADAVLRTIPVVVLTSSAADEDILRTYDLGVSSYIQKPVTFEKLLTVVDTIGKYWIEIVKLPPNEE
jgi:CheY-like chemotaxis protein